MHPRRYAVGFTALFRPRSGKGLLRGSIGGGRSPLALATQPPPGITHFEGRRGQDDSHRLGPRSQDRALMMRRGVTGVLAAQRVHRPAPQVRADMPVHEHPANCVITCIDLDVRSGPESRRQPGSDDRQARGGRSSREALASCFRPAKAPSSTLSNIPGNLIPSAIPIAGVQDPVHHLGACGDDGTELVPVEESCGRRPVVPRQSRDLLDGHAVSRHQGHEGMAQVPGTHPVPRPAASVILRNSRQPLLLPAAYGAP